MRRSFAWMDIQRSEGCQSCLQKGSQFRSWGGIIEREHNRKVQMDQGFEWIVEVSYFMYERARQLLGKHRNGSSQMRLVHPFILMNHRQRRFRGVEGMFAESLTSSSGPAE